MAERTPASQPTNIQTGDVEDIVFESAPPDKQAIERGKQARAHVGRERVVGTLLTFPSAAPQTTGPNTYHDPIADEYGSIDGLPTCVAQHADITRQQALFHKTFDYSKADTIRGQATGYILVHTSATARNETQDVYRPLVAIGIPSIGSFTELVGVDAADRSKKMTSYLFDRNGLTVSINERGEQTTSQSVDQNGSGPADQTRQRARQQASATISPEEEQELDQCMTHPFVLENKPTRVKYVVPVGKQYKRLDTWLKCHANRVFRTGEIQSSNTFLTEIVLATGQSAQPVYVNYNAMRFTLYGFAVIPNDVYVLIEQEKAQIQTAHPERDTWLAITQNRELRTLFAQVIAKAHSRQTVTSKPYVCKQNKQMDDIHRDLVDTRRRLAASLHTILLPGTF